MEEFNTNTNIEVGDIVKYLPEDPSSWIGIVTAITNNEETNRHGHSGNVYIIKDLLGPARIAARKENLLKYF
jgi:hypothetical protein